MPAADNCNDAVSRWSAHGLAVEHACQALMPVRCGLQGVIGDTYERFNVGMEAYNPNSTYYLPEDVRSAPFCCMLART